MPIPEGEIKKGWEVVNKALADHCATPDGRFVWPEPLATIRQWAEDNRIKPPWFEEKGCGITYDNAGPRQETRTWQMTLMFGQYVAGMLWSKAEDHCYNHKKPCAASIKLHFEMLNKFADDLHNLADEIRQLPKPEAAE